MKLNGIEVINYGDSWLKTHPKIKVCAYCGQLMSHWKTFTNVTLGIEVYLHKKCLMPYIKKLQEEYK